MLTSQAKQWKAERIEKIEKYLKTETRMDFIDDAYIETLIEKPSVPDIKYIETLIEKSKKIMGLTPEETAYLLNIEDPAIWEKLFEAARIVKNEVYGNRIVLFAPMYLSSACVNNCVYCGFRDSNEGMNRKVLTETEITAETKAMTKVGHKRVLAVFGEDQSSDYKYMARAMEVIYASKNGKDDIRRVNINGAPLFVDEYKVLKDIGIGTYQIFQETYNKAMYAKMHGKGHIKSNYKWRLFGQHRAMEAGIGDVAIGALFGLYKWKFEVIAMLYHSLALEKEFGVGTHTISFPRLEPALNTDFHKTTPYAVSPEDMKKVVAMIRLSVPYTGLILTARETAEHRRELIQLGVSQTDAGTNITIGGYQDGDKMEKKQFDIADKRSLDEYISELVDMGYIPSFCTADYRCGRTGCSFMDFAKTGKMKKFCIPNAVLTFKEYLIDYASPEVKVKGAKLLADYAAYVKKEFPEAMSKTLGEYMVRIDKGERDLYF
ncbi:MAG: [FeFe] hydrogenase H-cluster radical SAM maturase HydG [bacterium]